jgi:hydrogenase nickel incorporation protein HypB
LALNKIDLFPCLDFDMEIARTSIGNIYPGMPIFEMSATTEAGMNEWIGWLTEQVKTKLKG